MPFAPVSMLDDPTLKQNQNPKWDPKKPYDLSDVKSQKSINDMMGKDIEEQFKNFMTILVTMFKNPDPTENPSTFEITQSLMGFVQATGMSQNNELTREVLTLMQEARANDFVDLLGKDVFYHGNEFTLTDDTFVMEYDVANDGKAPLSNLEVSIFDPNDFKLLAKVPLKNTPGRHRFEWDGIDMQGNQAKVGESYQVTITGSKELSSNEILEIRKKFPPNSPETKQNIEKEIQAAKKKIDIPHRIKGRLDFVEYDQEMNPYFTSGKTLIPVNQIERVAKRAAPVASVAPMPTPYGPYLPPSGQVATQPQLNEIH